MGSLNPLDQIQPWVIASTIAIFVVTLLVLRRVFFRPYVEVMERRELELADGEATHRRADLVAAGAEREAERVLAEARAGAEARVRAGRDSDQAYRRSVLGDAEHEASRLLEDGRERIARQREAELRSMREQAVECVGLACERLLGASDGAAVSQEVDKLLARRLQ